MRPLSLRSFCAVLGVSLCLSTNARAGDAPAAAAGPSAADVQKAIDGGAGWLRREFAKGFDDVGREDGVELVVLTLAHAGANASDPVFSKGVAVLEKVEPRYTYRTALLAMALAEVNPRLYQWKIAQCAQWLVDTQLAGGEWGYPGTANGPGFNPRGITVSPPPPPPPEAAKAGDPKPDPHAPRAKVSIKRGDTQTSDVVRKGDFSNTQLAILGLRACREAGVEAPKETWTAALEYLKKFQRPEGGWGYVVSGEQDEASYASLTCAGACSVAICANALGSKDVRSDPNVKRALAWLDKHLDIPQNVGIDRSSVVGPSPWQYYHLYSLERAGRVLGLDVVGKRAWYAEGAKWIVAAQQADGRWEDGEGAGAGGRRPSFTVADTCFALLFLTRATRPLTGK
jgi:hypothetical protein